MSRKDEWSVTTGIDTSANYFLECARAAMRVTIDQYAAMMQSTPHIGGDLQTLALLDLLENAIDSRPTEDGGQEPDSSVPPSAEWERWTQMAS